MSDRLELLIVNGELAGKRFSVPKGGIRLGRASASDIAIPDEELSRSHSMFERRASGELTVLDLASANGTFVNGENIGADVRTLKSGDLIEVGATLIKVVPEGFADGAEMAPNRTVETLATIPPPPPMPASVPPPPPPPPPPAPEPEVADLFDLGLDGRTSGGAAAPAAPGAATRRSPLMNVLWVVAVAVFVVAIGIVLCLPSGGGKRRAPAAAVAAVKRPALTSLMYEKVEADDRRIFRYLMTVDESGVLRVVSDDVPGENRHVDKSAKLSDAAKKRFAEILSSPEFRTLDTTYTGASAAEENALKSWRIRFIEGEVIREVLVENAVEPNAFYTVREALETFSRNELGVWALQYSREQLMALSEEDEQLGDAKWEEREVEYGNLFESCRAYREAVFYLDTVNPKPARYAALKGKLAQAERELDARYREQRFLADKAINLGDWATAKAELRILCDLVPDKTDKRHAEANAKLVDVEKRMKQQKKNKGDRK